LKLQRTAFRLAVGLSRTHLNGSFPVLRAVVNEQKSSALLASRPLDILPKKGDAKDQINLGGKSS